MASTGIIYTLIARDAASRTFHQVGRAASRTDTIMGKLAKTAKIAGEALAVGLAVGLAEGTKAAVEFQSEMTRISTQAGGTAKDVKMLSDQVLKLGTSTQQGPQHLAESLYHLKSVGMDNVQAMKALKEASDLAAVGHANLEETTNALAGAWRTGIKGATSFHEAVSTVNAIIGAGNMSMDQFNAAIGTGILPSAKTFGLSMKQVGAALALMTDEGIDSASAATRLRMSFSLLGAPSAAAEKQLGKIGLTGLNLADAMRGPKGLIGAIGLLKEHLDKSGLSASRQSQLLSRAFGGGRSSSGILLMLNNLDVLEKKQEQINRSTGKFDDAVKMQRKTAEAQWHLLTSNLEVMGIRVGTKVLPYVTDFVHFLATTAMPAASRFGQVMGDLIPVQKIKTGFATVKGMVNDFLSGLTDGKGVGATVSDFVNGLTGRDAKKAAPKASKDQLPSVMLTRPQAPRLIAKPTKAITPGLKAPSVPSLLARPKSLQAPALFRQKSDPGMLASPKAGMQQMSQAQTFGKTIHDAIAGGIKDIDWSGLGSILGKGLGSAFQWVISHGAELAKKLGQAIGAIDWVDVGKQLGKIALPFAIGFTVNLFEPMMHPEFWKKHWLDTILAVISVVPLGKVGGVLAKLGSKVPWGRLGEVLSKIPWQKLIPFGERLARAAGPIALKINEFVARMSLKFLEAFARHFPKIAEWFARELGLLPVRLAVLGLELARKGNEIVVGLARALVEHLPGAGNRFIRAAYKAFGRFSLYQIGINLAKSLASGAWSVMKSIGSWLKGHIVDPITNGVKSLFGIKSPSRVFMSIGRNLIAGLKSGIVVAVKGIGGWIVDRIVNPVKSPFSRSGSWLPGRGSSMVSGFKSGIYSVGKSIGGWVTSHVINPVKGPFARSRGWLPGKGSALISGLKSGITGAMKGIGGWIKSRVVDPVVGAVKRFFGIKSPSRVFMSIGGHLVNGLLKGMSRTSGTAIAKRVFGSLPKALAHIVKKGLVSLTSLPGKAMKALGGLGGNLLSFLGIGGGGGGGSVNRWSGAVAIGAADAGRTRLRAGCGP
jgi:TP901 family phage tail tape measure protein